MGTASDVLLDILEDFEEFISKLENRRAELEDLKDELLIYRDLEFMESITRGLEEMERGETVTCKDSKELSELFDSL